MRNSLILVFLRRVLAMAAPNRRQITVMRLQRRTVAREAKARGKSGLRVVSAYK